MESTSQQSFEQKKKERAKRLVTRIYNNTEKNSCSDPGCINKFCSSFLKREHNTPEGDEVQSICFRASLSLMKYVVSNDYIPEKCPPLPLFGEKLDELLLEEDNVFLDEISKVF